MVRHVSNPHTTKWESKTVLKGIQVVGIIVGLYLLVSTILEHRRGFMSTKKAVILSAAWTVMTLLFYNTRLVEFLLPILSTEDAVITVLVLGLLSSFVLNIHTFKQVNRMEYKLTRLVQNLAVNDYIEQARNSSEKDE